VEIVVVLVVVLVLDLAGFDSDYEDDDEDDALRVYSSFTSNDRHSANPLVIAQAFSLRRSRRPFRLPQYSACNKPEACWDQRKLKARATIGGFAEGLLQTQDGLCRKSLHQPDLWTRQLDWTCLGDSNASRKRLGRWKRFRVSNFALRPSGFGLCPYGVCRTNETVSGRASTASTARGSSAQRASNSSLCCRAESRSPREAA
jgi:hypothetical protein